MGWICRCGDWRPIDSAPKDGTKILSLDNEKMIETVAWSTRDEKWYRPNSREKSFWHGVTHWMPLPNTAA